MNMLSMDKLSGSENDFLRTMINIASKGSAVYEGVLFNSTLYIIVNNGLVYTIDLSSFFPQYIKVSFTKDTLKQYEDYIEGNGNMFQSIINRCYNITLLSNTSPLIYDEPNLRIHPEFEEVMNSKSSDGSYKYYIDTALDHRTFMIIQKNMFNLTKQDGASLKVYNLGNGILYAKFDIYKKKLKINVQLHFTFMDLLSNKKGVEI